MAPDMQPRERGRFHEGFEAGGDGGEGGRFTHEVLSGGERKWRMRRCRHPLPFWPGLNLRRRGLRALEPLRRSGESRSQRVRRGEGPSRRRPIFGVLESVWLPGESGEPRLGEGSWRDSAGARVGPVPRGGAAGSPAQRG